MSRLTATIVEGGGQAPLSLDFSDFPGIPGFTGASWAIVGGVAVNIPTLGTESLSNGNMETGSPPTGWDTITATPASVADERTGGTGTKALQVTLASGNYGTVYQAIATTIGKFHELTFWAKKGSATAGYQTTPGSVLGVDFFPADVAWTQYKTHYLATAAAPQIRVGCYDAGTTLYDDFSDKEIIGVFAGFSFAQKFITVKGALTLAELNTFEGVFLAGNTAAPVSGVFAVGFLYAAGYIRLVLYKLVNNTYTVLATNDVAYVAGAFIEIRRTANTTFQSWYNNTQVGTDQTVSDSAIINNTYVGMLSTGGSGNSIGSFFLL
jgi:hypothetical protein